MVDALEIDGLIEPDGIEASGGDVALALIDEHDVVVHDLRFHAVAGNPHEHHLPGIALAVQEIAPESIAALRIAADLELPCPADRRASTIGIMIKSTSHEGIGSANSGCGRGRGVSFRPEKGASWRTLPCPVKIQLGETFNFEHKDSNTSYPGRARPFS